MHNSDKKDTWTPGRTQLSASERADFAKQMSKFVRPLPPLQEDTKPKKDNNSISKGNVSESLRVPTPNADNVRHGSDTVNGANKHNHAGIAPTERKDTRAYPVQRISTTTTTTTPAAATASKTDGNSKDKSQNDFSTYRPKVLTRPGDTDKSKADTELLMQEFGMADYGTNQHAPQQVRQRQQQSHVSDCIENIANNNLAKSPKQQSQRRNLKVRCLQEWHYNNSNSSNNR